MADIKSKFDYIVLLADTLDENGIDCFKFPKAVSDEQIKEWESTHNAKLPQGYKDFILLANGFDNHGSEIYQLEQVIKLNEFPEEFKGYYAIGGYIGDGSLILSDDNGEFYYGDHTFGLEKSTFEDFLDKWIIKEMEESLQDNGVEIPEH